MATDMKMMNIELGEFLLRVMDMRAGGFRFIQAHAVSIPGGFELSYTFGKDYDWATLRLVVDEKDEVPTVTNIYPTAFIYENEMKELFGVDIRLIEPDYKNKLYRIEVETPMKKEVTGDGK